MVASLKEERTSINTVPDNTNTQLLSHSRPPPLISHYPLPLSQFKDLLFNLMDLQISLSTIHTVLFALIHVLYYPETLYKNMAPKFIY
jgi:hypothetical protein